MTEKIQIRPNLFEWDSPKVAGELFNLTADEWNRLIDEVNNVREYKNLSQVDLTVATRGIPFTADMYNQVGKAIQEMVGESSSIPMVKKGTSIEASMLNILVSELNSIQ